MGREIEVLANILEVDIEYRRQRNEQRKVQMEKLQSGHEDKAIRGIRAELASNPTIARKAHLEALLPQDDEAAEAAQENE